MVVWRRHGDDDPDQPSRKPRRRYLPRRPQLLGFIDPSKSQLSWVLPHMTATGRGFRNSRSRGLGEIDFIVAGALTGTPFEKREVEGRSVWLETIPEIIAKKVYYRGAEARPRDIFDIAAASGSCRSNKGAACRAESGVRQTDDRTAHDHARLRGDGC